MKTPYRKYVLIILHREFPDTCQSIIGDIDLRYVTLSKDTSFAATSSNPMDKRLDFAAYFLAIIQVMEKYDIPFDRIKALCVEIAISYVQPKYVFHSWLKRIPAKLMGMRVTRIFLQAFNEKLSVKGNVDGFRAEILTDKNLTFGLGYGVNILECGICKLFHKNGADKYAAILCEVDKVTSGLAGLELVRTSTIALGAPCCDFRWKRI